MSGAPDFSEPLLGFRVWGLGPGDTLVAAAHGTPWSVGANEARCLLGRHRAPAAGCRCGFNALHDLPEPALTRHPRGVAGAVAAWGEIELHRDGFRAERACVLALGLPSRTGRERRERVERVAQRYGVPLVPIEALRSVAMLHARPAGPVDTKPAPPSGPAPALPATGAPPARLSVSPKTLAAVDVGRGWWVARHAICEWNGGSFTVGAAAALALQADPGTRITTLAPGDRVGEGEAVCVLRTGRGTFGLCSPVSGTVIDVNPDVIADPTLAATDSAAGGWIARINAGQTLLDECPVVWGRRGREAYERWIERVGPDTALAEITLPRILARARPHAAADVVDFARDRLREAAAAAAQGRCAA